MKITLLGTGTPAPSLTRQSSGYVFEVGDDVIVMDHGPGSHQRLLEAGYKATDVTHFLISHYHYDHVMDYPRMVLTRWDHARPDSDIAPLNIYGPDPLQEINDRFIGPEGAFALDINARLESPASQAVYLARGGSLPRPRPNPVLRQVKAGDIIEGKEWRIIVGPAQHVQPHLECLAYRLESEAGSVVYSGDHGGVYQPYIDFAKDADVIIQMNHFFSGTELTPEYRNMSGSHIDNAETAKQANVGKLVLSHFLPMLDKEGVKEQMIAEMSTIYKGPIVLGEDLMEISLDSSKLGGAD